MSGEKESSLYGWSFIVGSRVLKELELLHGKERAEKKMETFLLTLRSELIPDRFRRALIDFLIEVSPNQVPPIREELRADRKWRIDEFYRYSTAILAGLFDALNKWRRESSSNPSEGGEKDA